MFHRWSVAHTMFHRWSVGGRAVVGGLRGRVAGLEIFGVEKICGFGAILRVVSGPENLGGVGNPGWARDAPSYTHAQVQALTRSLQLVPMLCPSHSERMQPENDRNRLR